METKKQNQKTEQERLHDFIENEANIAALEPFCRRVIELTKEMDVWSILMLGKHIQAILDESAKELERPIVNKN